jgi:glycosyltransferase involved in cell wall biosynthesis
MAVFKARKLSIIVPVYNEERTVALLLKRVSSVRLPGLRKEILVVNDGSSDRTAGILKKIHIPGMKSYHHDKNRGKGAAIRTAIRHATGDVILIQDADLEYDPSDYTTLLRPLLNGDADVVYGSRFQGPRRVFLFWHFMGNILLTFVTNLLYNTALADMETCYKVFKRDVLRTIPLKSDRFDFEPEVTAKVLKRGYRLYEVPISYRGRDFSEGKKITWKDGVIALITLIRYRFTD